MNKILIIKTSALGDIVQVYPVVSYLKAKFPDAEIDWVVEELAVDLVKAHPDVNRAIPVATKRWRKNLFSKKTWQEAYEFNQDLRQQSYDLAFDFQGNTKSGLILSQVKAKLKIGFGYKSVPEKPNLIFTSRRFDPSSKTLNIRDDYLSLAMQAFGEVSQVSTLPVELKITDDEKKSIQNFIHNIKNFNRPIFLVCPGSAWKNKQMTLESLKSFLAKVEERFECQFIFAWGTAAEKLMVEDLQRKFPSCSTVLEKMSLPMLQNVMELCDFVIAMDSLPLHLAGTTKTPTFSVFGASSANKYKPLGNQHLAFQGPCPYAKSFDKRCPVLRTCKTGACIRNLHEDDLFASFLSHPHLQSLPFPRT